MQEGKQFFDITDDVSTIKTANLAGTKDSQQQKLAVTYPSHVQYNKTVQKLIPQLNKANFEKVLKPFSEFHNRYYKSDNGKKSSEWLQDQIKSVVDASGVKGVTVKPFSHSWPQSSIIVTVPGKSEKTVVLGAHQDSINQASPSTGRAPGAGKSTSHNFAAPTVVG